MTHCALRNELLLRWGEVPKGVLVITKGSVRVQALLELAECRFELLDLGRLTCGDSIGLLAYLKQSVSRFSFLVASRHLSYDLLREPLELHTLHTLQRREAENEQRWEQLALERLESMQWVPELNLPFRAWASERRADFGAALEWGERPRKPVFKPDFFL